MKLTETEVRAPETKQQGRKRNLATCHPLQFFPKNNLRIQKVRVGVSLYVQLTFYGAL